MTTSGGYLYAKLAWQAAGNSFIFTIKTQGGIDLVNKR